MSKVSKVLFVLVIATIFLSGCQTKKIDNYKLAQNKVPINFNQNQNINNTNNQDTNQIQPNLNMNEQANIKLTTEHLQNITPDSIEYSQAIFKTSLGDITIEFYKDKAPVTVANFIYLAKNGFYDNTKFHRVIKDFMIQAGDPQSKDDNLQSLWGTGGPGYKFADEINDHKLVRGSLAMANAGVDTNGSQFFIVTATSTPWLDGAHTNFGEVVAGLDVLLEIGNVATGAQDRPVEPVVINSIELE